ncbi:MAG: hypothetical protein ABJB66_10070 [Gemmatimonadaceae bacterium]
MNGKVVRGKSVTRCVGTVAIIGMALTSHESIAQSSAKTGAAPRKTTSAAAKPAPQVDDGAAFRAAEEDRYYATLMGMRRSLLARSSWAPMGEECNTGALRVFGRDTSKTAILDIQAKLDRMEQLVTLNGAGRSIDDKDARALSKVIGEWEAGISRPNWDSDEVVPRKVFAAGMTGEFPDPNGKGCLALNPSNDTLTFWISAFNDVAIASTAKIKTKTYGGVQGLARARDEFFRAYGADTTSVLEVIALSPIVRWREWAVVGVKRLRSDRGISVGQVGKGGTSYLMRRVQNEWRLVAVTRTWAG